MNYQFEFLNESTIDNSEDYTKFFSEKIPIKATVLDLFCGCGGLSLGFQREGFNVLAGLDNDETNGDMHNQAFYNICKLFKVF